MKAENVEEMHVLKSLSQTIEHSKNNGYTKNFMAVENGLMDLDTHKIYQPNQVKIANFYRFEGESDPADNSILYAIETFDGGKGILTDSYGPYADINVNNFIRQVEEISKKPHHTSSHRININKAQRIGSVAAGILLLLASSQSITTRKTGKKGYLLPLLGTLGAGFLLYRGGSGHCMVKNLIDKTSTSH